MLLQFFHELFLPERHTYSCPIKMELTRQMNTTHLINELAGKWWFQLQNSTCTNTGQHILAYHHSLAFCQAWQRVTRVLERFSFEFHILQPTHVHNVKKIRKKIFWNDILEKGFFLFMKFVNPQVNPMLHYDNLMLLTRIKSQFTFDNQIAQIQKKKLFF